MVSIAVRIAGVPSESVGVAESHFGHRSSYVERLCTTVLSGFTDSFGTSHIGPPVPWRVMRLGPDPGSPELSTLNLPATKP